MGLIIGNRGLQGSPNLPYLQDTVLAGTDTYLQYVFLDRANTPVVPLTIQVELDDLTNAQVMGGVGAQSLVSTGASTSTLIYPAFSSGSPVAWEMQLTGAAMQMTYPYQGSQICKFKLVWIGVDSVLGNLFTAAFENIIELVSTPTVSGTL